MLTFGFQQEWRDFEQRNARFLERFPYLEETFKLAFDRHASLSEPIDKFILIYGRVCLEDFFEILLCSGNGCGQAAQKLLRGFYERAVTLRYLHENPAEYSDFLDFFLVGQRKLMLACRESMGEDLFAPALAAKIESDFQAVKGRFVVTDCEVCGSTRLNHTWSRLDFVSIAKRTRLGRLVVPAYYVPLRETHATVASMISRIEASDTGGIKFKDTAERKIADTTLRVAHNVLLDVLHVQDEHFALPGLKERIDKCSQDYAEVWHKTQSGQSD